MVMIQANKPGNTYRKGRFCTIDLLQLTTLDQMLLMFQILITFYKTSYLDEEVNCIEPFLSLSKLDRFIWQSLLLPKRKAL